MGAAAVAAEGEAAAEGTGAAEFGGAGARAGRVTPSETDSAGAGANGNGVSLLEPPQAKSTSAAPAATSTVPRWLRAEAALPRASRKA